MNASPAITGTPNGNDSSPTSKRARLTSTTDEHASKRFKQDPEEPSLYSENVRRKLAATTRTGQACDRCKERKMKCDPDPIACQPCRSKGLKCYTTDRVTGQPRERGQSDRADHELQYLRDQLALYQSRYGPLASSILQDTSIAGDAVAQESHIAVQDPRLTSQPNFVSNFDLPDQIYAGWTSREHYGLLAKGPVEGTKANILEWGSIDSGAFDCEIMREPLNDDIEFFNFSTSSVLKSIYQRQRIQFEDLQFPTKQEAMDIAETFMNVMWAYYPVVHKPAFRKLIYRFYDARHSVSLPEKIQVVQMLGILSHQNALRNQVKAEKIKDSHRYFHFALGHFPDLIKDNSLPALQALSLILLQFRNMPRPGYTWNIAQELLLRCIDLDYHRHPDRIPLPPEQQNTLAKELRKRTFHAILGICITTGCRLGRPAPWQFVQWDVPLPEPLLDTEISEEGINSNVSGRCQFWPALQLAKLLPLYTELHNYVLSVRRPLTDYLEIVQRLKTKVEAWRADWDRCVALEEQTYHIKISGLLIDSWAAEYILNLHHPSVCPANDVPEVMDKNLSVCHKAARTLLINFHTLSNQYKAADFTWHTTVAYTLAFGLVLHIHNRARGKVTQEQFRAAKNEINGWLSCVVTADLVLCTEGMLYKRFNVIQEQVLAQMSQKIVHCAPKEALPSRPFNLQNGVPDRSAPMVKQESTLISPRPLANASHSPPIHDYGQSLTRHFFPDDYTENAFIPSTMSTTTFSTYAAPQHVTYPNLPTSLAPLLNETPPNSIAQFQQPMISVQDPAMMFSPQLYTDAAAVWPLDPGASYSG